MSDNNKIYENKNVYLFSQDEIIYVPNGETLDYFEIFKVTDVIKKTRSSAKLKLIKK